jgi:hypothetical protein
VREEEEEDFSPPYGYALDPPSLFAKIITPQFQIWLSSTRTLSKTRTRTNPAYAFVLASCKRVNPGVEMHLALGFIRW